MSKLRMVARGRRPFELRVAFLTLAAILTAFLPNVVRAQSVSTQWPMGGRNLSNTRNQPFTGITRANVGQLTTKWVLTTGGGVSATPAVVDGVVYFPDQSGNFYAVEASTGRVIWSHKISGWTGISRDVARDDPAYVGGKNGATIILGDQGGDLATFASGQLSGPGARVMAVNAGTGQLRWVAQVDSFAGALITSSPVVFDDVVYVGVSSNEEHLASISGYPCCVFQGSVVSLNQATGKILWQTHDMPSNGGQQGGYSGGAVWGSTPVVDSKRGSLYVGTGNNYTTPPDVYTCIATAEANGEPDSVCNGVDNYSQDYFDSVLALDLTTGAIKWSRQVEGYDAFTSDCNFLPPGMTWCPSPTGPDYDFGGAGPNFFTATINGATEDVVGAGQKSGVYWAFDPDNGNPLWDTLVGPGSALGGIMWGTATDGKRIYVPIANATNISYTLQPSGQSANGGSWSALDPATGLILWQTATPGTCQSLLGTTGGCEALGPATVANGVVYGGSTDKNAQDPTMFALNTATGQILWSFVAGSSVKAAPAIAGNSLYWGSVNNKLYAFTLPAT